MLTFNICRLPDTRAAEDGLTPYERFHGKPYTGELYPFGCRVEYSSLPQDREKFGPRAKVYVVASYGPPGARVVMDMEQFVTHRRIVLTSTRDCQVDESEFPMKQGEDPGQWRLYVEQLEDSPLEVRRDKHGRVICRCCGKLLSEEETTCGICLSTRGAGRGRHEYRLRDPPVGCVRPRCFGHAGDFPDKAPFSRGAPPEQCENFDGSIGGRKPEP